MDIPLGLLALVVGGQCPGDAVALLWCPRWAPLHPSGLVLELESG